VSLIVMSLERRRTNVDRKMASLDLSSKALDRKLGGQQSVQETLNAIRCMHDMLRRQTVIEGAILAKVTYQTPREELEAILRFFQGWPLTRSFICLLVLAGSPLSRAFMAACPRGIHSYFASFADKPEVDTLEIECTINIARKSQHMA
jgi:hypothetical protein